MAHCNAKESKNIPNIEQDERAFESRVSSDSRSCFTEARRCTREQQSFAPDRYYIGDGPALLSIGSSTPY